MHAIIFSFQGCACPNVSTGHTCVDCFAKSKGNIGKWVNQVVLLKCTSCYTAHKLKLQLML